jgi:hypothetical protein
MVMRTSPSKALKGLSPAQVLFGFQPRRPIDPPAGDAAVGVLGREDMYQLARETYQDVAREATEVQRERQSLESARREYPFKAGDLVRRKTTFDPSRPGLEAAFGQTSKWGREFMELWQVLEAQEGGRFLCRRLEPADPPRTETLDGAHLKKTVAPREGDPYTAGQP